MSDLIYNLIDVMNKQAENYEKLCDVYFEKRETILQNDIKNLKRITQWENEMIGKNQKLEKERIIINREIALILNVDEESLTVSKLAELTAEQNEEPLLLLVAERLGKAMEKLKISNNNNKLLIHFSIDYIDFYMNLLRENIMKKTGFAGDNYGLFDAKQ